MNREHTWAVAPLAGVKPRGRRHERAVLAGSDVGPGLGGAGLGLEFLKRSHRVVCSWWWHALEQRWSITFTRSPLVLPLYSNISSSELTYFRVTDLGPENPGSEVGWHNRKSTCVTIGLCVQ